MRIRIGIAAVAVTAASLVGGAVANAATPLSVPELGAVGYWLTPDETAALAKSAIPDVVDRLVPADRTRVGLADGSRLGAPGNVTFASNAQVLGEVAEHPGGTAAVLLANPFNRVDPGAMVIIVQVWEPAPAVEESD
ncbi:hypothetical protein [Nocardia sp. NPDC052566]|uniref:hypothetical protein n=1 Tax=Nocardia sp. NPDC052566 TaxID=3364330 RepID=UPI0037CA147D